MKRSIDSTYLSEKELASFNGLPQNIIKGRLGELATKLAFDSLQVPLWSNIQYKDNGRLADIDVIALRGNTLFFIEVKNWAERTKWTIRLFIDKVLSRFYKALPILEYYKRNFLKWIPNLHINISYI